MWLKFKSSPKVLRSPSWPLRNICVTNDHEYISFVVFTIQSLPRSWFINGISTRVIRRVLLVEHWLLILPENMSSPRSQWCSCCSIVRSFDHCMVCPSLIFGFWLFLWYHETFLIPHILMNTVPRIIRMLIVLASSSNTIFYTRQCSCNNLI